MPLALLHHLVESSPPADCRVSIPLPFPFFFSPEAGALLDTMEDVVMIDEDSPPPLTHVDNKENSTPPAAAAPGVEAAPPAAQAGASSATTNNVSKAAMLCYRMPFVERYRPKTLDDVVGNEETVSRLRSIALDGNMPNLILSGPPGTGKTTSVHALARQLLGNSYKDAVLELNASDARGIDVRPISRRERECVCWKCRCRRLNGNLILLYLRQHRWSGAASRASP
jgi:ATPase family associated with various cellular activities (AAA)